MFKQIVLQEGIISCILNQPFLFIHSYDVLKATGNDTATKNESCELQESQGLQADFDGFSEGVKNERFEPQILLKNQEVTSENATSVLSGWGGWKRFCQPLKPLYFRKYFLMGGGMATLCVTLLCHTHLQLKDSIQNCT